MIPCILIILITISLPSFCEAYKLSKHEVDSIISSYYQLGEENAFPHLLSKLFQHDFPHENNVRRKLQSKPTRECNSLLTKHSKSVVVERMNEFIQDMGDDIDRDTKFLLSTIVTSSIKYGVVAYKLCTSCIEFNEQLSENEVYQSFCGNETYGYDATTSGVLFLPWLNEEMDHNIFPSTDDSPMHKFKGSIFLHPSESASFYVASEEWSMDAIEPTMNIAYFMTSIHSNHATLVPDYLGYGESFEYYKSYLIKKAYQTSSIPLYFKSQQFIAQLTSCTAMLSNSVSLAGYSEGGYSTVAVADALYNLNYDVIRAQAGAGPYQLSNVMITTGVKAIQTNQFPSRYYFIIPLWASSYSSTNPNLQNYNQNQNLASVTYLNPNDFDLNIVNWTLKGLSRREMNTKIPPNDPLRLINSDLLQFIEEANQLQIIDPCESRLYARGVNDKICLALRDNDVIDIINDKKFHYTLCHSRQDEIVSYLNIVPLNETSTITHRVLSVSGSHDDAGTFCFLNFILWFISADFVNYQIVEDRDADNAMDFGLLRHICT